MAANEIPSPLGLRAVRTRAPLKVVTMGEPSLEAVPNYTPGEKTDKLTKALIESAGGAMGSENLLDELTERLQPKKRNTLVTLLVGAIVCTGGPLAVVYTTQDTSEANSAKIEALEPRLKQVEKHVGAIKTDMEGIAGGIDELKEENVNRLKTELEDAKQALRRERNSR